MYYFIGIKGSGMSSLACILKDCGYDVTGSDIQKYIFTQKKLEEHNIPFFSFSREHIKSGMQVIIGNAFDDTNEEVQEALNNPQVKTYTYPEFLGFLTQKYHSICVSGTHGKTTTTGMLAHVFASVQPSGYLIGDGSGYMPKDAQTFILEACEYKRNFLAYAPDYAIVLNLELDHVDYYRDFDDYQNAFGAFVKNVKKGIAVFGDQKETHHLQFAGVHLFYGLQKHNDVYADHVIEDEHGVHFDCFYRNELFSHFDLPFYGVHLLWNALGVIAIGIMNGLSATQLQDGLKSFKGVSRRFHVEEVNGYVYIDDYAHHPTAIALTIDAAKQKYPNKKIVAIFQPDRMSRIAYFLDQFADAFKEASKVYLLPFPENTQVEEGVDVTIRDLREHIDKAVIVNNNEEGVQLLASEKEAVYLFMSSKDIYKFKDKMKDFQKT